MMDPVKTKKAGGICFFFPEKNKEPYRNVKTNTPVLNIIYGIFHQRDRNLEGTRNCPWSRAWRMGCDQPPGGIRQ